MDLRIVTLPTKKLIGIHRKMTLADDKTFMLWQSFMPLRKQIKNNLNNDLFSLRIYDCPSDLNDFKKEFTKWAAIEVADFDFIPAGMETLTLTGGLYAVFPHKGSSSDHSIYQYIYGSWLPNSGCSLDNRPHFEIMGEKYKNNDPASEEEIWIPLKPKK